MGRVLCNGRTRAYGAHHAPSHTLVLRPIRVKVYRQSMHHLLHVVKADSIRVANTSRSMAEAIAQRDKSIRKAVESGLSQRRVAAEAGIAPSRVHAILHGR